MRIKIKTTVSGKIAITSPYNKDFTSRVKLLGAKWNPDNKTWVLEKSALEDLRALCREIYGEDDQPAAETADVELSFTDEVMEYLGPVTILGRTISSAVGRDSGARAGESVMITKGDITSGGSARNWASVVTAGTVAKLVAVPKQLLENVQLPEGVELRVISQAIDRDALVAERDRLLARLAEIEELLA